MTGAVLTSLSSFSNFITLHKPYKRTPIIIGGSLMKQKESIDQNIKIKLIDGTQINAKINIRRDPGYDRLSDIVASKREPFLILSNASSFHAKLDQPVLNKVLFVNKDHIVWAAPMEEDQEDL